MPFHTKRAVTDEAIARLRREAEVLASVRHPGIVELVEFVEGDESAELHTHVVDGPSLAEAEPMSVEEIAGLMAAVTATLADLHELGVVHGRLDPSHVIVGHDGRPVLCGLSGEGDAAGDTRAVGDVITALLATLPDGGGRKGRHLAAIAANAQPPASLLAATLAARIEGSRLPGLPAASDAPDRVVGLGELLRRPRRRRVPVRPIVVGCALTVLVGGAAFALRPAAAPLPPVAAPVTTTTTALVTTTTTAAVPVRVWPTSTTTTTAGRGPLVHDGARWEVGEPGDIVVTGDWRCTGQSTVALLRPASGEVYVFADWSDAAIATLVGTVDGATALEAADRDGDGCADLVVSRRSGEPVLIDLGAVAAP